MRYDAVLAAPLLLSCLCGCGTEAPKPGPDRAPGGPTPPAPVVASAPGSAAQPVLRAVAQAYEDALADAQACSRSFQPTVDLKQMATKDVEISDERGIEVGVGRRVPGRHVAWAIYVRDLTAPQASALCGIELRLLGAWKEADLDALREHIQKRHGLELAERYLAPLAKAGRSFELAAPGRPILVGRKSIERRASIRFKNHEAASQTIEVRIDDPALFPGRPPAP